MQRLFFVSLLAVYASTPTSAWNFINRSQYCVAACALALNKVTFHLTHKGTKKTEADLCSGLYVQSLFDCSAIYCSDKEIKDGLKEQNSTCVEMAGFPLPDYDAATEHMTLEALANVTRVSKKSATADNYTHAVVPDDTFYHNAQRTIVSDCKPYVHKHEFT